DAEDRDFRTEEGEGRRLPSISQWSRVYGSAPRLARRKASPAHETRNRETGHRSKRWQYRRSPRKRNRIAEVVLGSQESAARLRARSLPIRGREREVRSFGRNLQRSRPNAGWI